MPDLASFWHKKSKKPKQPKQTSQQQDRLENPDLVSADSYYQNSYTQGRAQREQQGLASMSNSSIASTIRGATPPPPPPSSSSSLLPPQPPARPPRPSTDRRKSPAPPSSYRLPASPSSLGSSYNGSVRSVSSLGSSSVGGGSGSSSSNRRRTGQRPSRPPREQVQQQQQQEFSQPAAAAPQPQYPYSVSPSGWQPAPTRTPQNAISSLAGPSTRTPRSNRPIEQDASFRLSLLSGQFDGGASEAEHAAEYYAMYSDPARGQGPPWRRL